MTGTDKKNTSTVDYIDDNERARKQKQFASLGGLDENIRNSLSDMGDDTGFRRDRSQSNEGFDLPPLPDLDDNKDLNIGGGEDGFLTDNYKSNDEMGQPTIDNKDPSDNFMMQELSTKNQGPTSDEDDEFTRDNEKLENDLFKNFHTFENDIFKSMKDILADEMGDMADANIPSYSDSDL